MTYYKPTFSQRGFTLIELMIVVAVIGILSAIAYPSYQEFVAKGRRADGKATLLMAQQWMERFYSENYSYKVVRGSTTDTAITRFPANLISSPRPGEGAAMYGISLDNTTLTDSAFVLTLARNASNSMRSDRCGDLQIDQYGRKIAVNFDSTRFADSAAAISYCWP